MQTEHFAWEEEKGGGVEWKSWKRPRRGLEDDGTCGASTIHHASCAMGYQAGGVDLETEWLVCTIGVLFGYMVNLIGICFKAELDDDT
jgi:hypothetical protein